MDVVAVSASRRGCSLPGDTVSPSTTRTTSRPWRTIGGDDRRHTAERRRQNSCSARKREKHVAEHIAEHPVARAIDARQSNAVVVSLVPIAYKCLSVLRKICPCEMATELRVYSPTAFSARISNFGPVANTEVTPSSLVT